MKSPGFKLYADDWLASTKIAVMTPAEEGAYIRLLCHQWNSADCTLPDDDEELAVLSRLGEGWFNGGSTKIRKCFPKHPRRKGRISNRRLLEERRKQEEWRRKSSEGGIKSGKSRGSTSKGGSTTLATKEEPKGNMRVHALSLSFSPSEIKPPHCARAREDEPDQAVLDGMIDSQAVRLVYETLGVVPSIPNQEQIAREATNVRLWHEVLIYWRGNENFQPRAFAKMLARYHERENGEDRNGKPRSISINTRNAEAIERVAQEYRQIAARGRAGSGDADRSG